MEQHADRHQVPSKRVLGCTSFVAAILLAVLVPAPLFGHPHVFIDARVQLELDDSQLNGFWAEWEFDRLFTSMIVLDFRVPREGEFNAEQIRAIEQGAFANLQHFNYFVFVVRDGERIPAERVENFTAFMRNGRIVYRFFVPYHVALSSEYENIRIQMYDSTFFTDIAFHETEPVQIITDTKIEKRVEIRRDRDRRIEFDAADTTESRNDIQYSGVTYPYELNLELRRP